jgi:hypothetical protein
MLVDDLDGFVLTRREQGRAWRLIARDLYDATDGKVDVTYETLRSWYPDVPADGAA